MRVGLVLQHFDLLTESAQQVTGDLLTDGLWRGVLQGGGERGEERPVFFTSLTDTLELILRTLLLSGQPRGVIEALCVDVGDLLPLVDGPGGHHDDLPACRAAHRVGPAGVIDQSHSGPDRESQLPGLEETTVSRESLTDLVSVVGGNPSHVDCQQDQVDILLSERV